MTLVIVISAIVSSGALVLSLIVAARSSVSARAAMSAQHHALAASYETERAAAALLASLQTVDHPQVRTVPRERSLYLNSRDIAKVARALSAEQHLPTGKAFPWWEAVELQESYSKVVPAWSKAVNANDYHLRTDTGTTTGAMPAAV